MISPPLELRPGVKVQYRAADSGEWREGTLVKSSANNEEWLVRNRFGRFWVRVGQLRPANELQEP